MKKLTALLSIVIMAGATQASVVFTEDFDDWNNGKEVQWDADWGGVGNNKGFISTNLTGSGFQAAQFINWRGAQHETAITGWGVGDSVVIKYDMKAYAASNNDWDPFYRVGITTNNAATGANGTYNNTDDGYLWHGLQQWGPNNQVQITGANGTRASAADVGADFSTGDYELDLLSFTYSIEKLATAGEFSTTLMFSNTVSGATWSETIAESNAGLWDASSSYFRMGVKNGSMDNTAGNYVDNISVEVIPEPATFGLVAAFGGAVLFIRRRFMV